MTGASNAIDSISAGTASVLSSLPTCRRASLAVSNTLNDPQRHPKVMFWCKKAITPILGANRSFGLAVGPVNWLTPLEQ